MRMDQLFKQAGKPYLYYPDFVGRFDISVNAAVFLCYIGWRTIEDYERQWKAFRVEDITKATGLTVKEQTTARAALVEKKLIEEHYARLEHTLKFRLSSELIDCERGEVSPNAETADGEKPKADSAKSRNAVSTNEEQKGNKRDNKSTGAFAPDAILSKAPLRQLTDKFKEEWQQRFGGPYKFNGAADGKAADDLLKLGLTVEQILGVAKKAWNKPEEFNCKHAMTLRGLHSRFNEIRGEVGALNGSVKKSGFGQICP